MNKKSFLDGAFYLNEMFAKDEPFACGKMGHSELVTLYNYWVFAKDNKPIQWDNSIVSQIINNAGVFPASDLVLQQFVQEFTNSLSYMDSMALWSGFNPQFEHDVIKTQSPNCTFIDLQTIEPFYTGAPWTEHLEGKNVLVVSPFTASIEKQYVNREKLWKDPRILPKFNLKTIQHQHSPNIHTGSKYANWLEMVEDIKTQMSKIDYDICLVGTGASSIPLTAYAKKQGKKAIHLGGPLQILFGIKGGRWDSGSIGKYFYNEYWTRPTLKEVPLNHKYIENGCYW